MTENKSIEVKELLTAAKLALKILERFFLATQGKGTIKRLKKAINNLEAKQNDN